MIIKFRISINFAKNYHSQDYHSQDSGGHGDGHRALGLLQMLLRG